MARDHKGPITEEGALRGAASCSGRKRLVVNGFAVEVDVETLDFNFR
jgi:hypothetical protein